MALLSAFNGYLGVVGIASALLLTSSPIARAADLEASAADVAEAETAEADGVDAELSELDLQCRKLFGKQAKGIEALGLCARMSGAVFGFAGYDFADTDIKFYGQRLAATGSFPFLYYDKVDVSDDTDDPDLGGGVQGSITFVQPTLQDPLIGKFTLQLYSEGDTSSPNAIFDDNSLYDGENINVYPGVVQEAWLKKGGFTVGIQPSKFDFMRSGFSFFPGYANKESTAAVAYTHRFDNNKISLSVSGEDASRRERQDGVLANYDDDFRVDPVLLLRARNEKNAVYHLSAAAHQAVFDGTPFGLEDGSQWGGAVRAGILLDFNKARMDAKKNPSEYNWRPPRGRFMFSAAYAKGALDYLGIPDFAVDYIGLQDGDLDLSEGVSAVASYEYPFSPTLRGILTGSGFWATMGADGYLGSPAATIEYDVDVYGWKAQAALEKVINKKWLVGAEAAFNWTRAEGNYDGFELDDETASYPEIKAYFTRRF